MDDETRRGAPRPGLNRRQLLVRGGQLGSLALAGGLLAACDSSGDGGGATAGAQGPPPGAGERIEGIPGPPAYRGGVSGGRLVVGWADAPNSLDPALGYNVVAWDAITQLLYAPLFAFAGQSGGPVPNAAAAMPKVSDDGRTLLIQLRDGVTFHNGRPVTAQDYKWSWERLLNPKTASWAQSYMSTIEGADAMIAGKSKTLTGVEVVDDRTLRVRLARPDFLILSVLSEPYTAPVPREEVEQRGKRFGTEPVGSGPFRIESYDDAGQRARFVRHRRYFWKGLPYLEGVEYRWGVAAQSQLQQLKAGDVGVLGLGVPAGLVAAARRDAALKDNLQVIPQLAVRYIQMNLEREPFTDVRVRRALNWAVDREELQKITFGESTAWGAPFPPGLADYRRIAKPYVHDPKRARRELAAAGQADGLSITLHTENDDPYPNIAQVVQSQLQEVGVRVSIKQVSANALIDLMNKNEVEFALTHWYFVQPTAGDLVNGVYVTDASNNTNGYSNRRLDELAKRAQASFHAKERNRYYAEIEQILTEDAPAVFLSSFNYVAAHEAEVTNFHYRGEYGIYYDRLWLAA